MTDGEQGSSVLHPEQGGALSSQHLGADGVRLVREEEREEPDGGGPIRGCVLEGAGEMHSVT